MTREAVKRVIERMYKQHRESVRFPTGKDVREMERKAQRIAETAERRKTRK